MFERNRIDNAEMTTVNVEATLADGCLMRGRIATPPGRGLAEALNGPGPFVDFETFDGERMFLAKSALQSVKPMRVPRAIDPRTRVRDLDGFDPRGILGVPPNAPWDEVRSAYHGLAKMYHPDRYANAELPPEVCDYLAAMARRVNAAYAALEPQQQAVRRVVHHNAEAVYTSPPR